MSIDPIQLVLSNYNKLSILRKQLEDRTREFHEIEATIRELLMYVKEVEYLKSISAAYSTLEANEQSSQLATLESRRALLNDLIITLGELLTKTEQEAKSGIPNSSASAAPRSLEKNSLTDKSTAATPTSSQATGDANKKPLSFDEFRKKFPTSGV